MLVSKNGVNIISSTCRCHKRNLVNYRDTNFQQVLKILDCNIDLQTNQS